MVAFGSRLPGRDRPDFASLVRSWHVDAAADDVTILAATGGRLPTDMFEFIPVVKPEQGTSFLTDLAGISFYPMSAEFARMPQGTLLELVGNPANSYDAFTVEVRFAGVHVAHIKRVHNECIVRAWSAGLNVRAELERIRANGTLKEVLVQISYP